MRPLYWFINSLALALLSGCGIKGNLVRPEPIPDKSSTTDRQIDIEKTPIKEPLNADADDF